MNNLRPSLTLNSVTDLTPELVESNYPNIHGIAFDLDKTLTGQHESQLPDEHIEALQRLSDARFLLGILSNARTKERAIRVHEIAEATGKIIGRELVVVTSLELNGIRKPNIKPFRLMAWRMSRQHHRVGYVGDQLFKDILGANRANYGLSVLVSPFGKGDDPRVKYLQRPVEAIARVGLGLPLSTKKFGN